MAGHPRRPALGKHVLAQAARLGRGRRTARNPCSPDRGTRRGGGLGLRRVTGRRDLHSRKKRGTDVGKTKAGKGMKLEVVVEASGLPLGLEVAAADVSEQQLLMPALDDVPVEVPPGTPVVADKGHDSDPLRDQMEDAGYTPTARTGSSRAATTDDDCAATAIAGWWSAPTRGCIVIVPWPCDGPITRSCTWAWRI